MTADKTDDKLEHIYTKITQGLLEALPSRDDLQIILRRCARFSPAHYNSAYGGCGYLQTASSDQNESLSRILEPHVHPVLLARRMFFLAAALRYIRPTEIIPGLRKHHTLIAEEMTEAAITLVSVNDNLVGTLDGLETVILESFHHIECGGVGRAWMTMRRAFMIGQLLGLVHNPFLQPHNLYADELPGLPCKLSLQAHR